MILRYGNKTWESATPSGGAAVSFPEAPDRPGHPQPVKTDVSLDNWRPRPEENGDPLPAIVLHGVRLHAVTEDQAIAHVLYSLQHERGGVVVTPNLDHLRRCRRDLSFSAMVAEADLVVADGMPLVWASRLQGTPLPQRVAGSDLISTLSAAAAERNRSIFLLGGAPGTADAAAAVLLQRNPQLQVAGTCCPPVGFENDAREIRKIVDRLSQCRPDIVYVALGSPKQERLIAHLRSTLPQSWWLGVGVSFSFLTGDVRRAPRWMRRTGLEWVHRLVQEPRRLFKRYLVVGVPFAARLLGSAAIKGLRRRLKRSRVKPETRVAPLNADESAGVLLAMRAGEEGPEKVSIMSTDANSPRGSGLDSTAATAPSRAGALPSLKRLRGLILLAGSVRPNPFTNNIGRSLLDLPVDGDGTILNHWLLQAAQIAEICGLEKLPTRVLLARNSIDPTSAAARFAGSYLLERDLSEYRGTGGVLGNLASDYQDDDLILVANAAQVLLESLESIVTSLGKLGGVVSLVSHQDGTPSGLMLVTCKALRLIPKSGFVDMKEQALPAIAGVHDVRVMQTRRPTGLPVRSLADYVMALRQAQARESGRTVAIDPLAEDWRPSFAVAEAGAQVDQTARVHDSVILAGGIVEAGAVVVRSVVCAGGVVRRDRKAVDQIVSPAEQKRHKGSRSAEKVAAMAASVAVVGTVAAVAQNATT